MSTYEKVKTFPHLYSIDRLKYQEYTLQYILLNADTGKRNSQVSVVWKENSLIEKLVSISQECFPLPL